MAHTKQTRKLYFCFMASTLLFTLILSAAFNSPIQIPLLASTFVSVGIVLKIHQNPDF